MNIINLLFLMLDGSSRTCWLWKTKNGTWCNEKMCC